MLPEQVTENQSYRVLLNSHNIPTELQNQKAWILWRTKRKKDGSFGKIPTSPHTGKHINALDQSHHVPFLEVLESLKIHKADGIGFVTRNSSFTAIDLDKCLNQGEISRDAKKILEHLNSYAEISPSGKGIRIFVHGKTPAKLRTEEIEIYPDWWVTVTGNCLEGYTEIRKTKELQAVYEEHKALAAQKQRNKLKDKRPFTTPIQSRYAEKALQTELEIIKSTQEGNRNNQLNISTFNLGQLIGSQALNEEKVIELLLEAALSTGLEHSETLTTIRGGLQAGKTKPRQTPISQFAQEKKGTKTNLPKPNSKDSRTGEPRYEGSVLLSILGSDWYNATQPEGDNALAARIVRFYKETLSYSDFGYTIFNGKYHEIDDRNLSGALGVTASLSTVVDGEAERLLQLSSDALKEGLREESIALAHSASRLARYGGRIGTTALRNALQLSASLLKIERRHFEVKAWKLGFQNCVVDRSQIRSHLREDFFLSLSPVEYHQNADPTAWLEVLEAITGGNKDFQRTIQMIAGYVLSGASTLRKIPWLYGPKGTGKSTFQELLSTVLGEMNASISPESLNERGNRERLGAAIWNRRLAVISEAGNSRISTDLLKTLSGGDSYPVRMLFKEQFQAKPTHVLMLVSNDPPRMDAYDDALKDRVIALPFIHSMKDQKLLNGARLEEERKKINSPLVLGFTTWAIEGMQRLLQEGDLYVSTNVKEHTQQFWNATDPYSEFFEDLDPFELKKGILKSILQERFNEWCDKSGLRRLSRTDWPRACQAYGLKEKRETKSRYWVKK